MLKTRGHKLFLVACLSFSFFVSFSLFMLSMEERYLREHLKSIGDTYAKRIEFFLDYATSKTILVSDFIKNDPQNLTWLPKVADTILDQEGLLSLELVWQNQLLTAYPPEYAAWGLQSDVEELKKIEGFIATEVRPLLVITPLLPDKTRGCSIMYPIYHYSAEHQFAYWGSCLLLMRIPDAFKAVGLEDLETFGYLYRLYRKDSIEDKEYTLLEAHTPLYSDPVQSIVHLAGEEWILELSLNRRWTQEQSLVLAISSSFILSLLVVVLLRIYLVLLSQREEVKKRAETDLLTGLFNKMHFHNTLEEKVHFFDKPFLLAIFDLNNFKMVNDTYSHEAGDQLVIEVARRIARNIKKEDLLFRIGGDEFAVIILPEIMGSWIKRLEQIQQAITAPVHLESEKLDLSITASMGKAIFPSSSTNPDELFRIADEEMFLDKEKSKEKRGTKID